MMYNTFAQRTLRKPTLFLAVLLGALLFATPKDTALAAQDGGCTESRLNEQQQILKKFVQDNPAQQMAVVNTIAEVENEYGGEVPRQKQCEVMDKVLNVLAGAVQRRTPIKR